MSIFIEEIVLFFHHINRVESSASSRKLYERKTQRWLNYPLIVQYSRKCKANATDLYGTRSCESRCIEAGQTLAGGVNLWKRSMALKNPYPRVCVLYKDTSSEKGRGE